MRDQAMHLPRQPRLVATTDSDHDESLFLERSRKLKVNVPNQFRERLEVPNPQELFLA